MRRVRRYRQNIWAPSNYKTYTTYTQKKGMINQAKPSEGDTQKTKISSEDIDEIILNVLTKYMPLPPPDILIETNWESINQYLGPQGEEGAFYLSSDNLLDVLKNVIDIPIPKFYDIQFVLHIISFRDSMTNTNFNNCPTVSFYPSANFDPNPIRVWDNTLKQNVAINNNEHAVYLDYVDSMHVNIKKYSIAVDGTWNFDQSSITAVENMRPVYKHFCNYFPLMYTGGSLRLPFLSNGLVFVYNQNYDHDVDCGQEFKLYGLIHYNRIV